MSSDRYTTLCTEKNLKNLVYRPTEADILKARQKAARRTQLTESRDVEAKKREEEAKIQGVRVARSWQRRRRWIRRNRVF